MNQYSLSEVSDTGLINADTIFYINEGAPISKFDLVLVFKGEAKPYLRRVIKIGADRVALMNTAPPHVVIDTPLRGLRLERVKFGSL